MNFNKPVFKLMPEKAVAIKAQKCPCCFEKIGDFRDELSKKEFSISGMCQKCQDSVFGGE